MVSIYSFIFYKFTKIKSFECPKSLRKFKKKYCLEHQMLGRRFICHIVPATQRNILEIDGFLKLRDAVDAAHSFENTTPGNFWLQFGCGNSSFFKNIVSTNELAPNFPPPMWKRGRHWISLFKKTHLFLIDPSDNLRANILKSIHSYLPHVPR